MSLPPKIKPSAIVNAYLFYAQRLLQFDLSPQYTFSEADKRVVTASVCLCLKQAWQAWLDELSRYLNKSLSSYADCLLPEHRTHPEIETLLNLQKQADSWFAQLLLCLEPIVQASPGAENSEQHDDETDIPGRIQVLQLHESAQKKTTATIPADAQSFLSLIESFKAYIRSVRARQEEW